MSSAVSSKSPASSSSAKASAPSAKASAPSAKVTAPSAKASAPSPKAEAPTALASPDKVTLSGVDKKAEKPSEGFTALSRGLTENFGAVDKPQEAAASEDPAKAADVAPTAKAEAADADDPGQKSVDLARSFEGMLSQDVAGQLGEFGSAGRHTNNCADFVSSVLEATDRGITRTESVGDLRQQLLDKGWSVIPQDEARPGDVWMTTSNKIGSRHAELVSTEGGTHTIGSNNITDTQQQITEREKEGGLFYGYREPTP